MGTKLNITAGNLFRTIECFTDIPKFGSARKVFSIPQIKKCDDIITGSKLTDSVLQLPEIRIDVDNSTCDRLTLTCSTDAVEDDEVNLLILILKLNYNNNNNE